jgi:hypothetical protein
MFGFVFLPFAFFLPRIALSAFAWLLFVVGGWGSVLESLARGSWEDVVIDAGPGVKWVEGPLQRLPPSTFKSDGWGEWCEHSPRVVFIVCRGERRIVERCGCC